MISRHNTVYNRVRKEIILSKYVQKQQPGYNVSACLVVLNLLCVDDLLTVKANPPPEAEFVDIFQKLKYSLSLLVRLEKT